jgi:hypothetical protein
MMPLGDAKAKIRPILQFTTATLKCMDKVVEERTKQAQLNSKINIDIHEELIKPILGLVSRFIARPDVQVALETGLQSTDLAGHPSEYIRLLGIVQKSIASSFKEVKHVTDALSMEMLKSQAIAQAKTSVQYVKYGMVADQMEREKIESKVLEFKQVHNLAVSGTSAPPPPALPTTSFPQVAFSFPPPAAPAVATPPAVPQVEHHPDKVESVASDMADMHVSPRT